MNIVKISGNIGRKINSGYTTEGSRAVWFDVATHFNTFTDWVRVCFYDEQATNVLDLNLGKGDFIQISGNLRTTVRNSHSQTYVRGYDIKVLKSREKGVPYRYNY